MAERDLTFEEQHRLRKQVQKESARSSRRRLKDREHLRLEIEARDILERMQASTMTLIRGYEDVQTQVGDIIQQPLSRERISAIKAAADIDKTLLDRVLPPLRPMEVEKPPPALTDPASLTDNALKRIVAEYLGIDSRMLPSYDPNQDDRDVRAQDDQDNHELH